MGQFIGVIRRDAFRDPAEIETDMASTFATLRSAATVPDRDRVLIHGEPEREAERASRADGGMVPVTPKLREQLRIIDDELGLGYEL